MKPRVQLAAAQTPDGGQLILYQHDQDFSIKVNGQELMVSRQHESELELARLGCVHLVSCKKPKILIGGLGMGFTLRQTLDLMGPNAQVVVGELVEAIVEWNRNYLGVLNGSPLEDDRVVLKNGDVFDIISRSAKEFDSILLDVDNGPRAMTDAGNNRLYGYEGIWACRSALRDRGVLAIWSAEPNKEFERRLMECGFHVKFYTVPAYKGNKSKSRFVWVASGVKTVLPVGGNASLGSKGKEAKKKHKRVFG